MPELTAAGTTDKDMSRNMLFHNITERPFTGYWNGKPRTFKPGEKKVLPTYLAEHFAKHLANQVLAKRGGESAEKAMSPKRREERPKGHPEGERFTGYEENPTFNELFTEICRPYHSGDSPDEDDMDELDAEIEALNAGRGEGEGVGPGSKPQIIKQGDDGDPDEDDFDLGQDVQAQKEQAPQDDGGAILAAHNADLAKPKEERVLNHGVACKLCKAAKEAENNE